MIDDSDFFRESVMRICGSIELERALAASVRFLRRTMPVDMLFLQVFDHAMKAMRIVAIATPDRAETIDRLTPLSNAAIEEMKSFGEELKKAGSRHVWLFAEDPCNQVLTREIAAFNRLTITSLMVMPLGLAEPHELVGRGSLVLTTAGENRFSQEHADLLSLLKEPFAMAMSNALQYLEIKKLKDRLADDNAQLQKDLFRISGDELIGADFGLRDVMHQIQHVAPTDSPVLLTGETGVGKDVIANAIHLASTRRDGPFIPVNCGAIPDSLLDSELFGHEKGAFTGALARKRGRFERADKGTILLDEIGEMPLDAQVRLLRVLQNREIERIGGTDRIAVDIRVIAATNKGLKQMVRDGQFREDLYFRLNVFPIEIPPLRERMGDIPALAQFFIERKYNELKLGETPRLAEGAIDQLMSYGWPGNVREMENVIERAMILSHGDPLRFDELNPSQAGQAPTSSAPAGEDSLALDAVTARHIRKVLAMTGGKIHGPGGAAELLDVNANTLRYRMKKLGIEFRKTRTQDRG